MDANVSTKTNAQNFYLSKIRLNFFEISNTVLKNENLIQICKSFLCLKIYFNHGTSRVVPCACVQVYHVIRFNTYTWHHSAGSMFEIHFQTEWQIFRSKSNFQISKLDLRFQKNSNRFSRHRSFRHKPAVNRFSLRFEFQLPHSNPILVNNMLPKL